MKRAFGLALLLWAGLTTGAAAMDQDYAKASLDQLVDDLATVDREAPGIAQMASYRAFIADDASPAFEGGVLGVPEPSVPPQMRELVRRGVAAVPILTAHLSDRRPTRLVVGKLIDSGGFFLWGRFEAEYDPRSAADPGQAVEKPFPGAYVVKIGDVCYALIGQIVNRRFLPVRYQPTGGIIINSPIEAPVLIDRVAQDWGNLDAAHHRDALLADIAAPDRDYRLAPAFARLRFYYPDVYRSLSGSALAKRTAFEAMERAEKSR
jgi:hypothetical protein